MKAVRDEGSSFRLAPGVLLTLGALFLVWVTSSWFIADQILASRAHSLVRNESAALDEQADNIARNIASNLKYLHGIPWIIAKDDRVLSALSRSETSVTRTSVLPVEEKKRLWTENSLLRRINGYLDFTGSSLAADVLWITNISGDCIAASNADTPTSFVGTNYADRHYFQMARAGKTGNQYAMGRKTNIAGLYFSAPITVGDRVVGAAVAKIDLVALSHWVNQADAFITDKFGVIILARDHKLEMRALSGVGVISLSKAEVEARYKRSEFPPISIHPWRKGRFPSVLHFSHDETPLLLAERSLPDDDIGVHVFTPLASFANFETSRLEIFSLLVLGGLVLAGALAGQTVLVRMRKDAASRMARSLSLLHAMIESTADGILVIDDERHVTTCNRRFAEMWGIPEEVLATGKDEVLLGTAVELLRDPPQFLEKVTELYAAPEATSTDVISLKDGRLFERYTYPQRLGDRVVGRVWSFRDVTARQRAEAALRSSLREKEVLLREIHHRVKNNMQVITSLLNLQAKTIADGAIRALFDESKTRVASMALIHEKLYRSEDLASVDFDAYTRELARDLIRIYNRPEVGISVDMGGLCLDVNLGIPCGLIINELISNSLKHAFPSGRKGTIRVEMRKDADGESVLTVADDGIGLPAAFDLGRTESLGLQLIQVLSGQINGSVEVRSGQGTAFVIRFAGVPEG